MADSSPVQYCCAKKRRVLIAPTSSGKSLPIQAIPLLSLNPRGKVVIVLPLIALQASLATAFSATGLRVLDTSAVDAAVESAALKSNLSDYRYILLSPERLVQTKWLDVICIVRDDIDAFVVDEAHCIYSW